MSLLPNHKQIPPMAQTIPYSSNNHRAKELKELDETRTGVKGLVDSGLTKIPRIFIHNPENLPKPSDLDDNVDLHVPVIDLQGIDNPIRRKEIVAEICKASESWGCFQLLNHGIPLEVMDGVMHGNKKFHEQDVESKAEFYSRDAKKSVQYSSNFDLYESPAAIWRDTISYKPDMLMDPEELPSVCRTEMLNYEQHVMIVVEMLCELLSEALGLDSSYLRNINSTKSHFLIANYYPACPEPTLTLGISKHVDPSCLTVVLQDDLGGLQVLYQDRWVSVRPIRGALDVNIGNLLQLISNDKFKSPEHRVLASYKGPRLSVAMFFRPSSHEERPYGPIKEVLSDENPPMYKDILMRDYLMKVAHQEKSSALNPLQDTT